jgi:hypothetical protein
LELAKKKVDAFIQRDALKQEMLEATAVQCKALQEQVAVSDEQMLAEKQKFDALIEESSLKEKKMEATANYSEALKEKAALSEKLLLKEKSKVVALLEKQQSQDAPEGGLSDWQSEKEQMLEVLNEKSREVSKMSAENNQLLQSISEAKIMTEEVTKEKVRASLLYVLHVCSFYYIIFHVSDRKG